VVTAYWDVQDREWALETKEAQQLLGVLPEPIRQKFIRCFLEKDHPSLGEVSDYFISNSDVTKVTRHKPGSAEIFEYLYNRVAPKPIDQYFVKCKGGVATYKRLVALEEQMPRFITKMFNGHRVLVDNVGSGPGRDMVGVLKRNPEIAGKVHIRNIDVDEGALKIGQSLVRELGLQDSFAFEARPFSKVPPRNADLILLIGILCPLKQRACRATLRALMPYVRARGTVVYSTAQERMVTGDPLTDFIMRFTGFNLVYKTDEEADELGRAAGWTPTGEFFDEPLHYHRMTVAIKDEL
jgi:hypothetical protein